MRILHSLKSTAARFAQDKGGNFALAFAAASTVLMLSVGLGIDLTRMLTVKSNLSQSLDAALLSTAREVARGKLSQAQARSKAEQFLKANLDVRKIDPALASFASFKLDPSDFTITATAQTDYRLAFPVFTMAPVQTIAVNAEVAYAERAVEVSMVLDVTGSMKGTKLKELKTAAKAAVAEFIDNSSGNTKVAIVPYSFGVNSGALKSQVIDEAGNPITGNSCATERRGPEMFTDASPLTFYDATPSDPSDLPVSNKVTRANSIKYNENGYSATYAVTCPSTPLQPLTKNSAALNSTIDSMEAIGGTAGQIGLQWGAYMLSPKWNSVLPASSKAAAYGTKNLDKFLILMTDGMFNSEASGLTGGSVPAYAGISQLSGRLAMTYCNEIKAKKIKLFTIGFRLQDINVPAQQAEAIRLLQDCATAPAAGETTFFNAENGAELTAAFKEIAKRVERVTLTN